ncbi:MAG: transcriptional regulator NrdR [Candidatus Saccharibacteria bacterium]
MKCSRCHKNDTKVIESRDVTEGEAIRRRRECISCQHRFTTYERVERPQVILVKNNGTRELFDREKLLAGLYRACEKTAVTNLQLQALVADVEQQLRACGDDEIATNRIGEMVMDGLAPLDEVAYVRFASVYRRFKDIAGFEKELLQIRKRKSNPSQKIEF